MFRLDSMLPMQPKRYRALVPAPSVFWNVDLVANRVDQVAKKKFREIEAEEIKRFFNS